MQMDYQNSPDFIFGQKIAAALSTPTSFMHDSGAQVAFVSGFVDALYKEANLGPVQIVEVLEHLVNCSPLEKTAAIDPSLWEKLKGSAAGAMVGFKQPGLAEAAKNQDWKSLLGQSWGAIKDKFLNIDTLKRVAPYAISGLGSYLAAKALGANGLGAAAAGLGGGALGGLAYNDSDEIANVLRRGASGVGQVIEHPIDSATSAFNSARNSMGEALSSARSNLQAGRKA